MPGDMLGPGSTTENSKGQSLLSELESNSRAGVDLTGMQMLCIKNDNLGKCPKGKYVKL